MKEQVEFFDTDFLGNKIEIGDKVILETLKYRDFAIGTVVSKAPKTCQVEYLSFNTNSKVTARQYYEQLIKCPKEGEWIKATCSEKDGNAHCSVCNHWDWSDCNYCSKCGAKMKTED